MGVVVLAGWLSGSRGRSVGAAPPIAMLEEGRSSDRVGAKRVFRGRQSRQRLPPSSLFFLLAGLFATTLFVSLNLVPAAGMDTTDSGKVVTPGDHGADEEKKNQVLGEARNLLEKNLLDWRDSGIEQAVAEAKNWRVVETEALLNLIKTLIRTASATPRYLRHRPSGNQFAPDNYVNLILDKFLKSFDTKRARELVGSYIFVNRYCPRVQDVLEPAKFLSRLKKHAESCESSSTVSSRTTDVENELKATLARTTECGEKGAETAISNIKSSTFPLPDFGKKGVEGQDFSAEEAAILGNSLDREDIVKKIAAFYLPVFEHHLNTLGFHEGKDVLDEFHEDISFLESGIHGPNLADAIEKVMDAALEAAPNMTKEALSNKIAEMKREIWYPPVMDNLDDPKAGFKNWDENFQAERTKLCHERVKAGRKRRRSDSWSDTPGTLFGSPSTPSSAEVHDESGNTQSSSSDQESNKEEETSKGARKKRRRRLVVVDTSEGASKTTKRNTCSEAKTSAPYNNEMTDHLLNAWSENLEKTWAAGTSVPPEASTPGPSLCDILERIAKDAVKAYVTNPSRAPGTSATNAPTNAPTDAPTNAPAKLPGGWKPPAGIPNPFNPPAKLPGIPNPFNPPAVFPAFKLGPSNSVNGPAPGINWPAPVGLTTTPSGTTLVPPNKTFETLNFVPFKLPEQAKKDVKKSPPKKGPMSPLRGGFLFGYETQKESTSEKGPMSPLRGGFLFGYETQKESTSEKRIKPPYEGGFTYGYKSTKSSTSGEAFSFATPRNCEQANSDFELSPPNAKVQRLSNEAAEPIEIDDEREKSKDALSPGNEPSQICSQDVAIAGIGLPLIFSLGAMLIALTFFNQTRQNKQRQRLN